MNNPGRGTAHPGTQNVSPARLWRVLAPGRVVLAGGFSFLGRCVHAAHLARTAQRRLAKSSQAFAKAQRWTR
jgi:hypothetical protein